MEYLLVHRGRRGQSYEYELLAIPNATPLCLKKPENHAYDEKKSGQMKSLRGQNPSLRPLVGAKSGGSRGGGIGNNPKQSNGVTPTFAALSDMHV